MGIGDWGLVRIRMRLLYLDLHVLNLVTRYTLEAPEGTQVPLRILNLATLECESRRRADGVDGVAWTARADPSEVT